MPPTEAPTTTFAPPSINFEYFFRVIYNILPHGSGSDYLSWLAWLWSVITDIAYIATAIFLAILVYATIRLHQLSEEEEPLYETLDEHTAVDGVEHSRWRHISVLIESGNENDWRQAIIEADIMLDDILTANGYEGDTVADKLKQSDPSRFMTLQDAWDAHRVRNDIAHQGSAYPLTGNTAYRTIAKYKNVFEEFHAI